jgi:hypothetical protein
MTAFEMTFLANSVTLVIAVAALMRRPITSYKIIAALVFCASGFALYQVLTGRGTVMALLSTAVLVIAMMWRIALNLRSFNPRRRP